MNALLWIDAPHFCCGVVVSKTHVVDAAPILRWAIGRPISQFSWYCRSKKWKMAVAEIF